MILAQSIDLSWLTPMFNHLVSNLQDGYGFTFAMGLIFLVALFLLRPLLTEIQKNKHEYELKKSEKQETHEAKLAERLGRSDELNQQLTSTNQELVNTNSKLVVIVERNEERCRLHQGDMYRAVDSIGEDSDIESKKEEIKDIINNPPQ